MDPINPKPPNPKFLNPKPLNPNQSYHPPELAQDQPNRFSIPTKFCTAKNPRIYFSSPGVGYLGLCCKVPPSTVEMVSGTPTGISVAGYVNLTYQKTGNRKHS